MADFWTREGLQRCILLYQTDLHKLKFTHGPDFKGPARTHQFSPAKEPWGQTAAEDEKGIHKSSPAVLERLGNIWA